MLLHNFVLCECYNSMKSLVCSIILGTVLPGSTMNMIMIIFHILMMNTYACTSASVLTSAFMYMHM